MSDNMDIRGWLAENRPDVEVKPKGPLPKVAIDAYQEGTGTSLRLVEPPLPAEPGPAEGEFPDTRAETRPDGGQGRRRGGWFARKTAPKATVVKRRSPIDGILTAGWGGLAWVFKQQPQTLPIGRCLEVQAPAAGMVLDDALKGSLVDKVLQPLARAGKRGEAVWACAGPPMLVGAITMNPQLYPVIKPMLREALSSWILLAGPKMRKAAERERRLLEELGGNLESIDEMIDAFFAPPPEEEATGAPDLAAAAA